MTLKITAIVALSLGIACAMGADVPPDAEGEQSMSEPSPFRVRSRSDLGAPLQIALQQALEAAAAGPARFEVEILPGVYERTSLSIRDTKSPSNLHIVVRGIGATPPVLRAAQITLHASEIEVENLVIEKTTFEAPIIDLQVGSSVVFRRVAVLENHRESMDFEDPVIRLRAGYRTGPQTARFEDSWFVGNKVDGSGALLAAETTKPDIFTSVSFVRCAFVSNATEVTFRPEFSETVTFDRSLVYEDLAKAVLWIRNTTTQVTFTGSTLSIGGDEGLVRYRSTSPIPREDYRSVRLVDTTVGAPSPDRLSGAEQSGSTLAVPFEARLDLATRALELARRGEEPTTLFLRD